MNIHFGYELIYSCPQPVPMILMLEVHPSRVRDLIKPDRLMTEPDVPLSMYTDGFGNVCTRIVAPPGGIRLTADGLIQDSGLPDPAVCRRRRSIRSKPCRTRCSSIFWAAAIARPSGS